MNLDLLKGAYRLIGELTPLQADCGKLCGAACCQPDAEGQGGVSLFPGEAALLQDICWGKIADDPHFDAPLLLCDDACDRALRPLGCRIFPLCPAKSESGKWTVKMDARARGLCPLARSGRAGLNPEFVAAVRKAIHLIASDPEGEEFLTRWSALESEFSKPLWT